MTCGDLVGGVPAGGKGSVWQVLDGSVLGGAVAWGSERLRRGEVVCGDLTGGCAVLREGSAVPVPGHVFLVLTFEDTSVYVFHCAVVERGFTWLFGCAVSSFALLLKLWSVGRV